MKELKREDLLFASRELKLHEVSEKKTLEVLRSKEELTPWEQNLFEFCGKTNGLIMNLEITDLLIPDDIAQSLGPDLSEDLSYILKTIVELNNDYVGIDSDELKIILSGDEILPNIMDDIFAMGKAYVDKKLKDFSHLIDFEQYLKISSDLHPFIEKLFQKENCILDYFLKPLGRFVLCEAYFDTWGKRVSFPNDGWNIFIEMAGIPQPIYENFHEALFELIVTNHCNNLGTLDLLYGNLFSESELISTKDMSDKQKKALLVDLASDLIEMRPYLTYKNYNCKKSIITLNNKCAVAWDWCFEDGFGTVLLGKDERDLFQKIGEVSGAYYFGVNQRGFFADQYLSWLTPDSSRLNHYEKALDINILILAKIHEKLYSFYEKIDVKKIHKDIEERLRGASTFADIASHDLAMSCNVMVEKLADEAKEDELEESAKYDKRKLKKMRSLFFFKILEKLGCSVRNGKGSEKVISRSTGRRYRLGYHKRNHYLSVGKVKDVLVRVGITPQEWADMAF